MAKRISKAILQQPARHDNRPFRGDQEKLGGEGGIPPRTLPGRLYSSILGTKSSFTTAIRPPISTIFRRRCYTRCYTDLGGSPLLAERFEIVAVRLEQLPKN